ncbi:prolactin-releasing peptide receptor-like [Saccoglossus kowalevskii]|uniref:Prolactin-releasing peptide receptor-like n=1 Tax=Saccoglossus kowalevskii TaxID=10224 RepID=A0ABM0GYA9_SACKO|nr:PREDICTED: prolactin-releasing peptide receptor-like [Saccoglossus kowalevskii]
MNNISDARDYMDTRKELPGTVLFRNISWLLILLYAVVFVIGSVGNLLLVCTVMCCSGLRNVTNFFIANLAASDFFMCIFCIPWTLAHSLMKTWVFGESMCRFVPLVQASSVYVSVISHVVIAIDRYIAVIYPLKPRLTRYSGTAVIVASWIIACCLASPVAVYTHLFDLRDFDLGIACFELWPNRERRIAYSITLILVQYIVPLIIVSVCYAKMSINLNRRVAPGVVTDEQMYRDTRRKQRTNRLLLAVVASFAFSWFPFNVFMVLTDTDIDAINHVYANIVFAFCHIIALSSTCYNPFIYAWLHPNFRKKLKSMLSCWRWRHTGNDNQTGRANRGYRTHNHSLEPKMAVISGNDGMSQRVVSQEQRVRTRSALESDTDTTYENNPSHYLHHTERTADVRV